MEIKFTEENLKRLEEVKSHYPTKDAALMGALWIAQEQFGWLSKDVMQYVGDVLGIPYEHVLGVAEFYTMYNKQPVGKYHLQVCTNVSCMLRGGYEIFNHISDKLGIANKEVTPDGVFSIEEVECLGSCATAPMLQLNNEEFYENLTVEKVDQLLESLKNTK